MADHRHKRDTNARLLNPFRRVRAVTLAAPLAVAATGLAVGLGVMGADPAVPSAASDSGQHAAQPSTASAQPRVRPQLTLSRGAARRAEALDEPSNFARAERRWTTGTLNLWLSPEARAEQDGEVPEGTKVVFTGRRSQGRVQIVWKGHTRWVTAGYLTDEKPPAAGAGLSHAPCPDPGVENGLTANAVYVYRSVCHAFPQITSYGGWDAHGEHRSGKALDIMTSDVGLGTAIADFLQEHASELHLYDIIWRQHIWTPVRAGEGWRAMPSRGSATANHYDHVHVSTY